MTVRVAVDDVVVARLAARAARAVPGVVELRPTLGGLLLAAGTALAGSLPAGMPATLGGQLAALLGDGGRLSAAGVRAEVGSHPGEPAFVDVTLVTRMGHNCRDLAQEVQRAVAAEVLGWTGLACQTRVTVAMVLPD